MAIDKYTFKQLCCYAKENPSRIKGRRILTLSRYDFPSYHECLEIGCEAGLQLAISDRYLDDMFSVDKIILEGMGFAQVDSMDMSPYEGADIIHDLNLPIQDDLRDRYHFILDGGTMEHVFNFPQVLKNIFDMLKVGGTFIFHAPYWYHPHHGYYSFSPELFLDYLEINKWEVKRLVPYQTTNNKDEIEFPLKLNCKRIFPAMHGILSGIVIKSPMTSCDVIPQQGAYDTIWHEYDKIFSTIKALPLNASVYVFGVGQVAKQIVNIIKKINPDILKGIVSDNPSEIGISFIHGMRVEHVETIKAEGVVFIGSHAHYDAIAKRLCYLKARGINVV